ncbi:MAG: PASTA domain-containing protein [Gaiellaceae bacterium]
MALGVVAVAWYLRLDRSAPPARPPVPSVVGVRERTAVQDLRKLGFGVRAVERPSTMRRGFVFKQYPKARTQLARGSTVTIEVANGKKPKK